MAQGQGLGPGERIDLSDAYAVKTPEDNRRLYAQWATTYDTTFIEANKYIYPQTVAELFNQYCPIEKNSIIVDVGCGTGAVGGHLAKLRPDCIVDGFDISPQMLEQASLTRRLDGSRVYRNLVEVDLTESLSEQSYDAMTSAGTFTHGHLGPETFVKLINFVRVGGWFVIGVNAEHYVKKDFKSAIDKIVDKEIISEPEIHRVNVYAEGSQHYGDCAIVHIFTRNS